MASIAQYYKFLLVIKTNTIINMDQLLIIEWTNFRKILNQHYQLPSLF